MASREDTLIKGASRLPDDLPVLFSFKSDNSTVVVSAAFLSFWLVGTELDHLIDDAVITIIHSTTITNTIVQNLMKIGSSPRIPEPNFQAQDSIFCFKISVEFPTLCTCLGAEFLSQLVQVQMCRSPWIIKVQNS